MVKVKLRNNPDVTCLGYFNIPGVGRRKVYYSYLDDRTFRVKKTRSGYKAVSVNLYESNRIDIGRGRRKRR